MPSGRTSSANRAAPSPDASAGVSIPCVRHRPEERDVANAASVRPMTAASSRLEARRRRVEVGVDLSGAEGRRDARRGVHRVRRRREAENEIGSRDRGGRRVGPIDAGPRGRDDGIPGTDPASRGGEARCDRPARLAEPEDRDLEPLARCHPSTSRRRSLTSYERSPAAYLARSSLSRASRSQRRARDGVDAVRLHDDGAVGVEDDHVAGVDRGPADDDRRVELADVLLRRSLRTDVARPDRAARARAARRGRARRRRRAFRRLLDPGPASRAGRRRAPRATGRASSARERRRAPRAPPPRAPSGCRRCRRAPSGLAPRRATRARPGRAGDRRARSSPGPRAPLRRRAVPAPRTCVTARRPPAGSRAGMPRRTGCPSGRRSVARDSPDARRARCSTGAGTPARPSPPWRRASAPRPA